MSDPLEIFAEFYKEIQGKALTEDEAAVITEILEEGGDE